MKFIVDLFGWEKSCRHRHVLCENVFINVKLICETALSLLKSLARAVNYVQ